jgi:integrating conjugative element membrane protein (TIGR03747 family)
MASRESSVFSDKGLWWMIRWWFYLSFFALAINWCFVFLVWHGTDELQKMLAAEMAYTQTIGGGSSNATHLAARTATALYDLAFVQTGIHERMLRFADPAPLDTVETFFRNLYTDYWDWIKSAMIGIQLFGVRLAILIQALPLFALAAVVAFCDGWWVGRYLRREGAGRESSFMYHRAKHYIFVSLVGVWLYLLLPVSVDPRLVIFSFVATFTISVRLWAAYFKKYL